jgi:hypothetical protein
VAMEGLFNEEKPSYTYETKNDFVPSNPPNPLQIFPFVRKQTALLSHLTFLDIDIGSFEASHYAAGAPSAQPFQLVDANTIRATRSSLRLNRTSSENSSKSSVSGVDDDANLEDTFVPSGPRPPTMDWKFPSFTQDEEVTQDEEEQPEEKETEVPAQEPVAEESFQAEKRATMQWTFPVMGSVPESQTYDDRHDTLRAPLPEVQPPPQSQPLSTDEPGDSRPSTSASNTSDSDYDPFRFDRPTHPTRVQTRFITVISSTQNSPQCWNRPVTMI